MTKIRTKRLAGVSAALLVSLLGIGLPATAVLADVPPANAPAQPTMPPQVAKLLQDADTALKSGNINLALIQLKNAVRLAPQIGAVRAQLGVALLMHAEADTAERELRQARSDNAPEEVAVPALLQAMLMRNRAKELLAEFPEPAPGAQDKASADILKARSIALAGQGQMAQANAAMDRALSIQRDEPTLRARVQLARQQNDLALANRLNDEALKLAPDSADSQLQKVTLLRAQGKAQDALAITDQLLKTNPRNTAARVARIEVLFDLKQDAKVKEEVDAILKQTPRLPLGVYYQAVIAARANDMKGAWALAVTLPPEFVQTQPGIALMVAQIAISSGNAESGGQILTTLITRFPDLTQARLQLAALRIRQNSPQAALATLDPVKTSSDPQVQAVLAQIYLQLRRYDDATNALEKAIAVNGGSNSDLLKTQLALTEFQAGNSDQAIKGLRDLVDRDPANLTSGASLLATLVQSGRADEALTTTEVLAKASPTNPLPVFYRGQILAQQGKLADSITAFGRALAIDPKFVPALYYRATLSVARGDAEQAKKDLQQVRSVDARNVLADVRLAEIALNLGQDTEAVALLNQAIKTVPDNPIPRLALANYQVSKTNYGDAQTTVNDLLRVSPNNAEGTALLGRIQFLRGAKDQAILTFRSLVAANPQLPAPQLMLADVLSAAGDKAGTEAAVRRAVQLAPASSQIVSFLVTFQISENKPNEALATARTFNTAHPGPEADLLMADTLTRLKRNDEANALLRKSLAAKPDGRFAVKLSQIALASGNPRGAAKALGDWVAKNPNDATMRRDYGAMLLSTGDTAGARREFEAVLKLRPEDVIALNNLGWIVQKENPARAMSMVTLAAKIAPRSAEIADTLGWLKLQGKDHQGALPLLQRAHQLNANDPQIGYHLALALDATGKRVEAKALLSSVLAKNAKFDGSDDAKQLVSRW